MRGMIIISLLSAMLLALTGCSNTTDELSIPVQDYAAGYASPDGYTGTATGTIRFPSEYNQRTVRFTVDGRKFITQPDGRFSLENLPAGQHTMLAVAKGYEPIKQVFTIQADQQTQLNKLMLAVARGKVIGRLVRKAGESAADVKVQLKPQGGTAVTNSDGIFEFIGIPTGDYKLQIADTKVFTYDRDISVGQGELRNMGNIEVHARIQLPVQNTARMESQ